ncbi:hypothetical protein KCTC32516_01582 [Polaribacter huanghezhanensis]|nr:hypothetical protein KCTC32516_01582 [Polaribacter huanghezhanensis]
MIKKILFFFFICSSYLLNAQYTNVINSNRPGFSESPYSVGTGIYQLETGLFYNSSKIVRTFTIPNSFGYNMVFRTSFFDEKLEFNTNFTLQKDKVAFKNVFTSSYNTTGISELSFGAKYLVFHQKYEDKSKEVRSWKRRHAFDWKRAIPSVAIYVGINTNLVNDIYKLEGLTPKFGILLQNNLSEKLNIITNIYYDYIGSLYSEFSYIITGTYAFNDDWSTFLEHQGRYNTYQTNTNFGTGIAYLSGRHFQVDASTRLNFNGKTTEFYAGLGFSFRLDRHIPKFDLLDEKGNIIVAEKPVSTRRKKFFGRLLDFFKFKKKAKKINNNYNRKKPVRRRIESTIQKAKKKKGGFFSFLKRKKKKKDNTKNGN